MLDKSAYYHGAAVVSILESEHCRSIKKRGALGYIVNNGIFLFLKYTTKPGSPWRFTFDREDVERSAQMKAEYGRLVYGFVCGGDGVCAVDYAEAETLLGGNPGFVAAARKHNHSYEVWGSVGALKRKVNLRRLPALVFEPGLDTATNPESEANDERQSA